MTTHPSEVGAAESSTGAGELSLLLTQCHWEHANGENLRISYPSIISGRPLDVTVPPGGIDLRYLEKQPPPSQEEVACGQSPEEQPRSLLPFFHLAVVTGVAGGEEVQFRVSRKLTRSESTFSPLQCLG